MSRYQFLVETYETERLKVLGVWSMFKDGDLEERPRAGDPRGRTPREHMIHQCTSENVWFKDMLGIDVQARPLPEKEERLEFMREYSGASERRLQVLSQRDDAWWDEVVSFFDVRRPRTWIFVRRIAHTAHHRGQQTALLRMLGRDLHSTYGPTADTGGLLQQRAPTIYAYSGLEPLLDGERAGGTKAPLPGPGARPSTERP